MQFSVCCPAAFEQLPAELEGVTTPLALNLSVQALRFEAIAAIVAPGRIRERGEGDDWRQERGRVGPSAFRGETKDAGDENCDEKQDRADRAALVGDASESRPHHD